VNSAKPKNKDGSENAGLTVPVEIRRWLMDLAADRRVLVPAEKDGNRVFRDMDGMEGPVFGLAQNRTLLPVKKAFLPPVETLFDFGAGRIIPATAARDTVIFGLHVCELSADRLLTDNMTYDRPDFPYLDRRNQAVISGVSCRRTQGCFCEKTGHDRVTNGEFDLFLDLDGGQEGSAGRVRLLAGSDAGRELAKNAPLPVEDCIEAVQAPAAAAPERWPLEELPQRMRSSFGAATWDRLAERCLGCGNCTIVCPLCYCFYTRDETGLDPSAGKRLRLWDSCQLIAFARVAGGHNFREARSERIWYRFSHKFMRTQEALRRPGCSGCGACANFCPVDIDPREVIASVLELSADA